MGASSKMVSADSDEESLAEVAVDAFQTIEIQGDTVALQRFQFRSADVAAYLAAQATDDRPLAFVRAIEVGVYCLERASTAKDMEFTKRQIERLINEMDSRVGAIPTRIQDELMKKVGSGDGQVLKPLFDASQLASNDLKQRIADCRALLIDIDPAKESSSVGKALKSLKDLLDPVRKDSVQGSLESAVSKVTSEDGALAKAVKLTVESAIKPLQDEVKELGKEIRGQEAAEEVLMRTTEKGKPYEEEVVELLQPWAKAVGAELEHVGGDNRPGDILLKLTGTSIGSAEVRLVIEVRDRTARAGRKAISSDLSSAMAERSSNAGIYLSRTSDGLGREVGDWSEGDSERGPWVATTHDHLQTAIRFLIALHRLRTLRSELPDVDSAAIGNQIQRIRTALDRVKTIHSKVTEVRTAADKIGAEADSVREEIRGSLNALEDTIRQAHSSQA